MHEGSLSCSMKFGGRPVSDGMMMVDEESTCHWISLIQQFLKSFGWLADSFVLDFYKDCHWTRLPASWQEFLPKLKPEELGWWLDMRNGDGWGPVLQRGDVPPLSLTAFKCCTNLLSLKRKSSDLRDFSNNDKVSEKATQEFNNLFNRHVKPKKRHEVERFSKVVSNICERTCTNHVFDVGSGLGHLARYLCYKCDLSLTCVDHVDQFGETATKFDTELQESFAQANFSGSSNPPSHLCLKLELNKHEKHLQIQDQFGIIGLHSCGNLSPVIIHNYVNSPAKFLVSVGCCYMKLDSNGFPLSSFAKSLELALSYEALEVSCHAIERYCQRLQNGQVAKLMTHAFRGALETILVNEFGIHRAGLKGVRNCEKGSFEKYAFEAVQNLQEVTLTKELVDTEEIQIMLKDWYKVVLFYSLRLLIAGVIETTVVLDRSLFIKENVKDGSVKIVTLFDPELSPRNFAVVAERWHS